MMYLSDLFVFTLLGLVPSVVFYFFYRRKSKTWMLVTSVLFFIFSMYVFISLWLVEDNEKMILNDTSADYYIYCGSYYQLEYRGEKGSDSIVIGSAPDNLDEYCDERLVRVEGRNSLVYGVPMFKQSSDNIKQIWKLRSAYIPVVHLAKIESLESPPTDSQNREFYKDLNLNNRQIIRAVKWLSDDVVSLNVGYIDKLGGYGLLAKKINGKWVEVDSGQDAVDCLVLDRFEIDRNLVNCVDYAELKKELEVEHGYEIDIPGH